MRTGGPEVGWGPRGGMLLLVQPEGGGLSRAPATTWSLVLGSMSSQSRLCGALSLPVRQAVKGGSRCHSGCWKFRAGSCQPVNSAWVVGLSAPTRAPAGLPPSPGSRCPRRLSKKHPLHNLRSTTRNMNGKLCSQMTEDFKMVIADHETFQSEASRPPSWFCSELRNLPSCGPGCCPHS